MKLKIESGIPIPRKNAHLRSPWVETLAMMNDGESFCVGTEREKQCILQRAKVNGFRVVTRQLENGTYRVWKVAL